MQITLNHNEITTAITEFIGNQGINLTHKEVEVTLIAGRGTNGHSASVTILEGGTSANVAVSRSGEITESETQEITTDEPEESTDNTPDLFGD